MQTCSLIGVAVGIGLTLVVQFLIWLCWWLYHKVKAPTQSKRRKYSPPAFGNVRVGNDSDSEDERVRESLFTTTSHMFSNSHTLNQGREDENGVSEASSYSLAIVDEPEGILSFGMSLISPKFPLSNESFQKEWSTLPKRGEFQLNHITLDSAESFECALAEEYHIYCKASGEVSNIHKFYLYARRDHVHEEEGEGDEGLFLVEVIVNHQLKKVSVLFKCQSESAGQSFYSYIDAALRSVLQVDS